jgi:hypothetical protein
MSTPTVSEILSRREAVAHDSFIDDLASARRPEPEPSSRGERPTGSPAGARA